MLEELQRRNYATITVQHYIQAVERFAKHFHRPPDQLNRGATAADLLNRRTAVGRRNYALVLVLARLGLRASEVVRLELEDIDWDAGQVSVRGKGGYKAGLPLPADVGAAMGRVPQARTGALTSGLALGRPACRRAAHLAPRRLRSGRV